MFKRIAGLMAILISTSAFGSDLTDAVTTISIAIQSFRR